MTVPSTGITGNIGGPQQPMPREIEASAWTMVNRAALGIMPDTLEIPFSKMGGEVWKYRSDPSRPTLKPVGTTRTNTPEGEAMDDSWKGPFEQLVNRLPAQTKARLVEDMFKPYEMRNSEYVILENTLLTTAKGLSWLEAAQKPTPPDSPEMERLHRNQGLAGHALRGAAQQNAQILSGAEQFLAKVGPNYAQHDHLLAFATQASELQGELEALLQQVQQGGEPPAPEDLADLANRATTLSTLFARVTKGPDLQILNPMLQALAAVASALSLTPTTPSLFFGLKMATTGLFKSDSAAGLLGAEFEALLQALMGGLAGKVLQKGGSAKQLMLLMMLLGTLTGAGTLGALLSEFGIGAFPAKSEADERVGKRKTFALLAQMLSKSGLLKIWGELIGEASGCDKKGQATLANATDLLTLLGMALTGAQGNLEKAPPFLEGLQDNLVEDIEALESEGQALNVALLQAKIALKDNNVQGFLKSLETAFSLANTTPERLMEDLEEFDLLGNLLQRTCQPHNEASQSVTSMLMAG